MTARDIGHRLPDAAREAKRRCRDFHGQDCLGWCELDTNTDKRFDERMTAFDAILWGLVIFLVGGAPFFLLIGYNSREIGAWLTRHERPNPHRARQLPTNDP